ncbi:hypothetical protein [Nonomuraea sp. NPDC049607]|uniref:hypothetical protein n=1 Tax=Nonomuraea sp. NPDC049607 TaxID=3154732 RepID=UPI003431E7F1
MVAAIARVHGLSAALVPCAYGAAVLTLTWLTQDGNLGDVMYGDLAMIVMAFPLYLAAGPLNGTLLQAVRPRPYDDPAYGWDYPYSWDYVLMAWPGVVTAALLAVLLARRRTRTAGRVLGWLSAAAVTLVGVATTFDGWGPRRPFGWPFLVYGLAMIIGLMTARSPATKKTATPDV